MPELAARPCVKPLCPEYAIRNGRCATHAGQFETARGSSTRRGYDAAWRKLRAMKLQRDPFCEIEMHCGKGVGISSPAAATEVDHKIPLSERPDLRLSWENLQSACKPCNAAKGNRYRA